MRSSARLTSIAALLIGPLLAGGMARAEVFHSREGALALAFPQADRIQRKSVFLDERQLAKIAELSGIKLRSKLLAVYSGYKGQTLLGHAFIDTHTVRTLPETFMLVVGRTGKIEQIQILAFHEPREYLPPERWLGQFKRHSGASALRLGGAIAGLAGSTLSAHAITTATRKILAIHSVLGLAEQPAQKTAMAPTGHP